MTDESLSDKIKAFGFPSCNMRSKDVKEAVKKLKEVMPDDWHCWINDIFGDKLIK